MRKANRASHAELQTVADAGHPMQCAPPAWPAPPARLLVLAVRRVLCEPQRQRAPVAARHRVNAVLVAGPGSVRRQPAGARRDRVGRAGPEAQRASGKVGALGVEVEHRRHGPLRQVVP